MSVAAIQPATPIATRAGAFECGWNARLVRRSLLFLVLLCGHATAASAFVGPIAVYPVQPVQGDSLFVTVTFGGCHYFLGPVDAISVDGPRIHVAIEGLQNFAENACIYPSTTKTFDIGSFNAGSYSLELSIRNTLAPFETFPTSATTSLSVLASSGAVVEVPGFDPMGMALLVLAVVSIGVVRTQWSPRPLE